MKTAEEILKPITLSYWESHQHENYLHEEGEYVKLEDAVKAMNEYALQFIHPKDCYQCDGTGTVIFPSKATQQCMICAGTGKLIILPMQQNT